MRRLAIHLFLLLAVTGPAAGESTHAARALGSAMADAVERVMPAVVVVRTEAIVYHPTRDLLLGGVYGIPERLAGQGSGVLIDGLGHILTSAHVVRNAGDIEVALSDGTQYRADVVGMDPFTDLAVLKMASLPGDPMTPIRAGDSDALRVGEFVIAVGSPFSLDSSVTLGIVSQKGRRVGLLPYEDFIQTDASINPGNSGGPLVDIDGRMVGINAMIQTGGPLSRGNVGIGFAVPAKLAMQVAQSIIRTGRAERPWLGVRLQDLVNRARAGRPVAAGVVIADVYPNTPAAICGLLPGDSIGTIDGQTVADARDVQNAVFRRPVGDPIKVSIERNGRTLVFDVVTESMPEFDRLMP